MPVLPSYRNQSIRVNKENKKNLKIGSNVINDKLRKNLTHRTVYSHSPKLSVFRFRESTGKLMVFECSQKQPFADVLQRRCS